MFAVVFSTVFLTSILSGVLGMAGGMILMAVLLLVLSVPATMVLHGAVQGVANGSRAWFLRRHIAWQILPPYCLGAALAVGLFLVAAVQPSAAWVLIMLGSLPWLALVSRRLSGLDITHQPTAVLCGVLVTGAQLFAGVSGALLDMFYLNAKLDRHAVVASKALTQTIGHVLKLLYWGALVSTSEWPPVALLLLAPLVAVAGTRVGTRLLDKVSQASFLRVSRVVILGIGTVCIVRGGNLLLTGVQ
ncbi:MAG: TSUP family transporter [Pseudomonadota bacterium]